MPIYILRKARIVPVIWRMVHFLTRLSTRIWFWGTVGPVKRKIDLNITRKNFMPSVISIKSTGDTLIKITTCTTCTFKTAMLVRLRPAEFGLILVLVTSFEVMILALFGSGTFPTKLIRPRARGKTGTYISCCVVKCSSWTAPIQTNRFARILVIVVGRTTISTKP